METETKLDAALAALQAEREKLFNEIRALQAQKYALSIAMTHEKDTHK